MPNINPFLPERQPDPIPRYLWRISSPSSAGQNTTALFRSGRRLSCPFEELRHLDDMSAEEAKSTLIDKLLYWNRESELISFSSSLLWVLQYAIYKTKREGEMPASSSVQICLLDTSKFPKGTFDSANSFLRHRGVSKADDARLDHRWFEAEYFAHGTVNIARPALASVVPLSALVARGLLHLLPAFRDNCDQLAKRVVQLRSIWFEYGRERPVTDEKQSQATQLARHFAERFQCAALISILALHKLSDNDKGSIPQIIRKPGTGSEFNMDLPDEFYDICSKRAETNTRIPIDLARTRYNPFWRDGDYPIFKTSQLPKLPPEVQQCCDIMDLMCLGQETGRNEAEDDVAEVQLNDSFAGLGVS